MLAGIVASLALFGPAVQDPPKGFTKLVWKKPVELVKAKTGDFAYGKVKLPTVEREVWLTLGHVFTDAQDRWRVTLDLTFNDNMDDDPSIETTPPRGRDPMIRTAEGEYFIDGRKLKLRFEFRDQILDIMAPNISGQRMISVKITKK
ncbi:MAG: hypothetical protein D6724_05880 [Armatimonadetes bacterium]|nr:MAG: hypothetical protein D6724_05880 [Armatimonadota bacterium]